MEYFGMTGADIALVALGAALAGAVNAVAGGGTFFSFPALLAVGVPPVVANASNSVALWPASLSGAWAYRGELSRHRSSLLPWTLAALLGGLLGGLLLLTIHDALFNRLIPWLLLLATGLFAFSRRLSSLARSVNKGKTQSGHLGVWMQGLVCIYGGFFGAGMGILMLASLAIQGIDDVHELNALKNWLSAVVYSVASITFMASGSVSWPHTIIMVIAASVGGYAGVGVSRRIPEVWLRRGIIVVGFGLSILYFFKTA